MRIASGVRNNAGYKFKTPRRPSKLVPDLDYSPKVYGADFEKRKDAENQIKKIKTRRPDFFRYLKFYVEKNSDGTYSILYRQKFKQR